MHNSLKHRCIYKQLKQPLGGTVSSGYRATVESVLKEKVLCCHATMPTASQK